MTRISTLLLAVAVSIGTIFASDTQVDGIWYNFNNGSGTAAVTYQGSSFASYQDRYTDTVVIPATVTYNDQTYTVTGIDYWAFYGCIDLTAVTIGKNVTSIGDAAFYGCSGLTSIEIPNSVTIIGSEAFCTCTGLTALIIPNSVNTIEIAAFYNCRGLTSVTIPNSVTTIGEHAFCNCTGLTSVTNYATTPQTIIDDVFDGVNISTCKLFVPKESVADYQTADVWKNFGNIIGFNLPEEKNCAIRYVGKDGQVLGNEEVTFHVPDAQTFAGFTLIGWQVSGMLEEGITIQAVYQWDSPTNAPEVYTNPANPAQKLIRKGNVYILSNDKTYTVTGQEIK